MKIHQSLEVLNALEKREKYLKILEEDLKKSLSLFFNQIEVDILKSLDNGLSNVDQIINEYIEEYYDLIYSYNLKAFDNGVEYTSLITSLKEKENNVLKSIKEFIKFNVDELFGYSKDVYNDLKNQTFQSSAATMVRVNKNINQILADGYKTGLGNREIGNNIKKEFQGLKTWETERIATTEINSAQNLGAYQQYNADKISYHQWLSANDKLTRRSHLELDGEIVEVGTPFSNGLLYPGDRNGPISEWINCRCTTVPFIMPYGYMAPPGMSVFRESDLIGISSIDEKLPIREIVENERSSNNTNSWLLGLFSGLNKNIKDKITTREVNSTTLTESSLLGLISELESMSVIERTKYFKKLKKDDIELYNYLKKIFKS